ncbi:MAG: general secretion pathway protein GspB [bacterium]|nr:general secretion pathway protein GspB [bacterium]
MRIWWGIVIGVAGSVSVWGAGGEGRGFVYDATGVRDPMVRQLFVRVTNGVVKGVVTQAATVRRGDIERAVKAARVEGVAISSRGRYAIINDRLVGEGDAVIPGQAIRVLRIERDKIVFVLDQETYELYLTPTKETMQ